MEFKKVSDRIYYLEQEDISDTPALGYVRGDVFSLMVDAGTGAAHVERFMTSLEENGLPEPVFSAVTHHHWDHSFGMASLEAITIACKNCAKKLAPFEDVKWTEERFSEMLESGAIPTFCEEHIRMAYPDLSAIEVFCPDMIFEGEMVIDLGGCKAVIMQIPSPHGSDCIAVYVPEEKVLFIGDGLYEGIVGSNWVDDPEEVIKLQKLLRNLDFEICIDSHSGVITKSDALANLAERVN
jgi:glyoxylase-like metal-dependent hydrolase (beta-lactamase superfamily II)